VYFHMEWLLQKTKESVGENLRESPRKSVNTSQIAHKSVKISKVSKNNDFVKKIKKENVFAESLLEEAVDAGGDTVAENVQVEAPAPPVEQRKVKKVNTFGCSVCPDISFEKKSEALAHLKSHAQEKKTANKDDNKSVKTEPANNTAQNNIKREFDPINTDGEQNITENDESMNESAVDDDKTPELVIEKGVGRAKTFGCSSCPDIKFEQRVKAEQHIRGHIPLLDRKQLMCEGCKERYATKVSLEKHVPVCQGVQVRSCIYKKCEQTFETKYDLKKHIREHKRNKMAEKAEQNKLSCKICPKVLKTKKSLRRHMENKHGQEKKVAVKVESAC